jgi:hypothetical protein
VAASGSEDPFFLFKPFLYLPDTPLQDLNVATISRWQSGGEMYSCSYLSGAMLSEARWGSAHQLIRYKNTANRTGSRS